MYLDSRSASQSLGSGSRSAIMSPLDGAGYLAYVASDSLIQECYACRSQFAQVLAELHQFHSSVQAVALARALACHRRSMSSVLVGVVHAAIHRHHRILDAAIEAANSLDVTVESHLVLTLSFFG